MDSDSSTDSEVRSTSSDKDFEEFFSDFGIRPNQLEPRRESNNDSKEEESEESDGETEDSQLTYSEW